MLVEQRPPAPERRGIHVLLFALTIFTTLLTGAEHQIRFLSDKPLDPVLLFAGIVAHPRYLLYGLPFSFTLMSILFAHEMGHYLACRYYKVPATLPYFIPMPIGPLGTFGAFIKIKAWITRKKVLFDIGIAGPIAGFALAVPAVFVGILWGKEVDVSVWAGKGVMVMSWGEPLLYTAVEWMLGVSNGNWVPHPIGFAALFGFFATALNLLPLGQLDGGHIIYSVLGRHTRYVVRLFLAVTLGMGVLWPGWFLISIMVSVMGLDHPPTRDEDAPIGRGRIILFLFAILIFALCFVPVPVSIESL